MLLNARVTAFAISELLMGNQQDGKITPPLPTQIRANLFFSYLLGETISVDILGN